MRTKNSLSCVRALAIVALSLSTLSCAISVPLNQEPIGVEAKTNNKAKTDLALAPVVQTRYPNNIIMVVADGMGPAYTTAYRYYKDNPKTPEIETTALDKVLVGSARTVPHQVDGLVTDSAASATALATGVKTYNGAIGVDVNKQALESVLRRAKKMGMKTGVAVTSQIVHATPASYIAHNEQRRNYNQIADSFLNDRIDGRFVADVMLGGGWAYFKREDANLIEQFVAQGYQYANSYQALAKLPKGKPTLGLFADKGLPWALDDTNRFRLSFLSSEAVRQLESPQGFFLLIEASQVDWAGHGNDIASAMAEMADLEETVIYLREYAKNHPDTLVIITADHSTGGLTIGADGEYRWSPEYLRNMQASVSKTASQLLAQSDRAAFVSKQFGFALQEQEIVALANIEQGTEQRAVEAVLKSIIDKRSNTGWTTSGHTGIDVEVFAFGPGAQMFAGNQDNTEIAEKIFSFLELKNAEL